MSQQIDNTSDQNLDGRSVCPGHALSPEGAINHYHCEHCEYPRGYRAAMAVYKPYRNDVFAYHIPFWEAQMEKNCGMSGGVTHYYWSGYLNYISDMLGECRMDEQRRESVLEAKNKLNAELGPREFTLTYSPDWFESDEQAQQAMRVAIEKLTKYYKDEIIEFHAVGEYTGAGRSHVHAWYHLIGGRKITDKNFKRAWSRWNPRKKLGKGFEGGHHASVNRIADFAGYIEKHLEEAWLVVDINANQEEVSDSSSPSRSPSSDDA